VALSFDFAVSPFCVRDTTRSATVDHFEHALSAFCLSRRTPTEATSRSQRSSRTYPVVGSMPGCVDKYLSDMPDDLYSTRVSLRVGFEASFYVCTVCGICGLKSTRNASNILC
jgi:hypothetical protein